MVELRQVRLWYLSLTSISLKTILHTNFESVLSQKKKKIRLKDSYALSSDIQDYRDLGM